MHRSSFLELIVVALLLTLVPTRSTSSAVVNPVDPSPSAEEIALLSSVSRWVGSSSGSVVERLESDPTGFDAFRRWNPREARRVAVSDLPWGAEIFAVAQRHSLDSLLVASIIEVESGFRADAISPRGAVGLMQIMPFGLSEDQHEQLFAPDNNIDTGARYLRWLLDRYQGDLILALAAYNAGPGAVMRFGGVPPYRETQAYVEKVLAVYVEHHQQLWKVNRTPEALVFG